MRHIMHCVIALCLVLAPVCVVAQAADWQDIGTKDDGDSFWLDSASISFEGGIARIWIKADFRSPGRISVQDPRSYSSSRQLMYFDTVSRKVALKSYQLFGGRDLSGGVLQFKTTPDDLLEWQEIPPGTTLQRVLNFLDAMPPPAGELSWTFVAESAPPDSKKVFVDVSTIKRVGVVLEAWTKQVFAKPHFDSNGTQSYQSWAVRARYDCRERLAAMRTMMAFSGKHLDGSRFAWLSRSEAALEWGEVAKDPIAGAELEFVCAQVKPE